MSRVRCCNFPGHRVVAAGKQDLRTLRIGVCIVSITRLMPGVHQPDPPGLIHDDLRLLPPWRGSSLFWGLFSPDILARSRADIGRFGARRAFMHRSDFVHRWLCGHGDRVAAAAQSGAMNTSGGILALVADAELRNEVERVGAAVGDSGGPRVRTVQPQGVGSRLRRRARRRNRRSLCRTRHAPSRSRVPGRTCRAAARAVGGGDRRRGATGAGPAGAARPISSPSSPRPSSHGGPSATAPSSP